MEHFECIKENPKGEEVALLKVACNPIFSGLAITAECGQTKMSQICPQTSPHEVVFHIDHVGSWTISGEYCGETHTTTVSIS